MATVDSIYNIGIIGYGLSAKVFHIPLIQVVPKLKLHAIVQRHPTNENNAEKDHPEVKIYRSAGDMVLDAELDVVVVTTTPDTHFDLTKLALENGKNVVVEKPFTPSHQEAEALIAISQKHRLLLTVYQNRRWDSDFLTVFDLIKNNTLGRIVEFETHFDRHRPESPSNGGWKTVPLPGGGAIYDLGSHLIDQVVIIFGMPKRITGFVGTQRENNTNGYEDSCTVMLHYDAMLATVKAAVVSLEQNQLRYWIRGVNGSFKKYHLDCQEDQLKGGQKPGEQGFGVEPTAQHGLLTIMKNGKPCNETYPTIDPVTYSAFYSQFAEALAGRGEVPVKPEGASTVIRLIELAKQSSQQGRTMIV